MIFGQTVDPISPTLEIRSNDLEGSVIQPRERELPPSGIYKLELKRVSTGDAIAANPAIAASGGNLVTRTYSNLAEGEYEFKAIDGLGNETLVLYKPFGLRFSLDRLG